MHLHKKKSWSSNIFPNVYCFELQLLRSSLVNNKTQAVVCDDLGMTQYALYGNPKAELKTKDRADLLEAFLGALYVDKGLMHCQVFCNVCFFPRLQDFIMNQDWNDPKSKLQQCCLTLRTMDGGEPDIPVYKWVNSTTRYFFDELCHFDNRLIIATIVHYFFFQSHRVQGPDEHARLYSCCILPRETFGQGVRPQYSGGWDEFCQRSSWKISR